MIKQLLLVGIGGGLGSIFRYLTSITTGRYLIGNFPIATFSINVIGCLIFGVLIMIFSKASDYNESLKLLFIVGFCGGFTTFSTFAYENIQLFQQQNYAILVGYTLASLLIGFLAIVYGMHLGKSL